MLLCLPTNHHRDAQEVLIRVMRVDVTEEFPFFVTTRSPLVTVEPN